MNEINKFLTVAMGECWHEPDSMTFKQFRWTNGYSINTDFSTPDGFFKLWNWAQTQDWFCDLAVWLQRTGRAQVNEYGGIWLCDLIINPERFAAAVYEFLKEQG